MPLVLLFWQAHSSAVNGVVWVESEAGKCVCVRVVCKHARVFVSERVRERERVRVRVRARVCVCVCVVCLHVRVSVEQVSILLYQYQCAMTQSGVWLCCTQVRGCMGHHTRARSEARGKLTLQHRALQSPRPTMATSTHGRSSRRFLADWRCCWSGWQGPCIWTGSRGAF